MYILQKKDVILEKVAGSVGGVGKVVEFAGAGAKMVGAKNFSKKLEQTSEKIREKEKNIRSNITPLKNPQSPTVGNEISQPKQHEEAVANNIVKFPAKGEKNLENIVPFSSSVKINKPYQKNWVHRDGAIRMSFPPPHE